jgi:tetratricopeptide (TPR) repeat protein
MRSRVVLCLLAAMAASPAGAQGNANATVCAADDDSAFSPEQRIAACDALIKAARNAPKEVADVLVNRGQAAWYADKMKQAFADLDRAIALDPNNARAFRERSNAYRSIGKLDGIVNLKRVIDRPRVTSWERFSERDPGNVAPSREASVSRRATILCGRLLWIRNVEEICDLIVNRQKSLRLPG